MRTQKANSRFAIAGWRFAAVILLAWLGLVGQARAVSLDPSFSKDGLVRIPNFDSGSEDTGVAVAPSGRVLLGTSRTDFAVLGYTASGRLDPGFGDRGVAALGDVTLGELRVMVTDSSGRILVGGVSGENWLIARFTANGQLDPSFGAGGIVNTDLGAAAFESVSKLAVDSQGRIVAVGSTFAVGKAYTALIRYLPNGGPDPSFGGGDGEAMLPGDGEPVDLGLDSKQRIVVLRRVNGLKDEVVRLMPDGELDASFSTDGGTPVRPGRGGYSDAGTIAIDSADRILVRGRDTRKRSRQPSLALIRLLEDGSIDPSFGVDGRVRTKYRLPVDPGIGGMAVEPDGRILVAAESRRRPRHGQVDTALIRFRINGALDRRFGKRGRAYVGFGDNILAPDSIAFDAQGRTLISSVIVAPESYVEDPGHAVLVRIRGR